jgi:nitrate reductase beta subunit
MLASANLDEDQAEAMYRLTTVPTVDERFVLPPYHREMSIEALNDPLVYKGTVGVGYIQEPKRGW